MAQTNFYFNDTLGKSIKLGLDFLIAINESLKNEKTVLF